MKDRVDLTAPLPLGYHNAVLRALELREDDHLSYSAIALVMSRYHGFHRGEQWWRRELRKAGTEPTYYGVPLTGNWVAA